MSDPQEDAADEAAKEWLAKMRAAEEEAARLEFSEHPPFTERPENMEELGARTDRMACEVLAALIREERAEARREGAFAMLPFCTRAGQIDGRPVCDALSLGWDMEGGPRDPGVKPCSCGLDAAIRALPLPEKGR